MHLTASTAGVITVHLVAADGSVASRVFDIPAGTTQTLTVAAPDLRVAVELPPATTRICTPGVAIPG
jgi:hypothetical protein